MCLIMRHVLLLGLAAALALCAAGHSQEAGPVDAALLYFKQRCGTAIGNWPDCVFACSKFLPPPPPPPGVGEHSTTSCAAARAGSPSSPPAKRPLVGRGVDAYNRELLDLVAIPSVSSLPDNHGDLLRAASWLEQRMKTAGLQVTMWHDRVVPPWQNGLLWLLLGLAEVGALAAVPPLVLTAAAADATCCCRTCASSPQRAPAPWCMASTCKPQGRPPPSSTVRLHAGGGCAWQPAPCC